MQEKNSRRDAIKKVATMALATSTLSSLTSGASAKESRKDKTSLKGNIHHSVCAWCYSGISLDELCKASKKMGLHAIDLIDVKDFPTMKANDMEVAIVASINKDWGIPKGWNRREHHEPLIEYYKYLIDETSKAGYKQVICFSGNRAGLDDEQGLKNCAEGLKKIMSYAEQKNVTVVMELLNSKVDHHDYQCDHTEWGVALAKAIGSERFKLLYDIYHMQIMEGDVIRTIRDHHQYISHYHTGGVPGRNEIDFSQELYYPVIMQAIVDTGFKGFVAQEFIPKHKDKLKSLEEAVHLCDV